MFYVYRISIEIERALFCSISSNCFRECHFALHLVAKHRVIACCMDFHKNGKDNIETEQKCTYEKIYSEEDLLFIILYNILANWTERWEWLIVRLIRPKTNSKRKLKQTKMAVRPIAVWLQCERWFSNLAKYRDILTDFSFLYINIRICQSW